MSDIIQYKRAKYYDKIYSLFEMLKVMKGREVVFMDRIENHKCIRGIWIKSIDYLKNHFDTFGFYKKDYNIYISSAKYIEIPSFTYNLKERSEQTSNFFERSFNSITEYDCLLDFDRGERSYIQMFTEVLLMKKILDCERVIHYIIPSGNNFQIVIPSEAFSFDRVFSNTDLDNSFNGKLKKIVENIKTNLKLKCLDLKNNGVHNRIMKCPYSLVRTRVCLPLFDIKDFKYTEMDSTEVLNKVFLKNRGIHYFNDFGEEKNRKNLNKFIYKYYLDV